MINKRTHQVLAYFFLILFLESIFAPTALMAVTSGPKQPEYQTFQQMNTAGMVSHFTGDFSYNLPLLTVPGPNGGYPVNLIYNAGIGMDQEASWTGLGWNINPGSIQRGVNGVPDDFKGGTSDLISLRKYQKENKTISASARASLTKLEVFGIEVPTPNVSVGFLDNTYRGFGLFASLGIGKQGVIQQSYNFGFNSQSGLTASARFGASLGSTLKNFKSVVDLGTSIGGTYATRGGWSFQNNTKLTIQKKALEKAREKYMKDKVSYEVSVRHKDGYESETKEKLRESQRKYIALLNLSNMQSIGVDVSFNSAAEHLPASSSPMRGSYREYGFNIGFTTPWKKFTSFGLTYSEMKSNYDAPYRTSSGYQIPGYGYMYEGLAKSEESSGNYMLDYRNGNNAPLAKDMKYMSYPQHTFDTYMALGHGVSGSFRPKRNDIGILHMNKSHSRISYSKNNGELGFGPPIGISNFGRDKLKDSYNETEFGPWRDANAISLINDYDFKQKTDLNDFYEPYYFYSNGEKRIQDIDNSIFSNTDLFKIKVKRDGTDFKVDPGGTYPAHNGETEKRKDRYQNLKVLTNGNYKRLRTAINTVAGGTVPRVGHVYSGAQGNIFPRNANPPAASNGSHPNHHIRELLVTTVDGMKYEYGLPAYNKVKKDVMFSASNLSLDHTTVAKVNDNNSSLDYFFETITPEYAHSYLLTTIYSNDYVDLTENGPTNDDLGYWVKFNYSKVANNFPWASPGGAKANYSIGAYTKNDDQVGTFTNGEKELYYLNSIETKTHVAEYHLSNRADSKSSSGTSLKKLDRIDLISKKDRGYQNGGNVIPLKSVHFKYTYEACPGIEDFNSGIAASDEPGTGKLTLKKVWFTYKNSNKGALTPYVFDYNLTDSQGDPYAFKYGAKDVWGNYKPSLQGLFPTVNSHFPYVDQTSLGDAKRDEYAGAWNLSEVEMPSGGKIHVEYESDDYKYVQDKEAMEMVKIVGLSAENETIPHINGNLSGKNRVYFLIDDQTLDVASMTETEKDNYVFKYLKGLDKTYYSSRVLLKRNLYDMVEGYVRLKKSPSNIGIIDNNGIKLGYFGIENEKLYSENILEELAQALGSTSAATPYTMHPFTTRAIKQLDIERRDLSGADFSGNIFTAMVQTIGFLAESISEMLVGYDAVALASGWGGKFSCIPTERTPGYIRLNSPDGVKYGGGYRVSKIAISDAGSDLGLSDKTWNYGTQYFYNLDDGTSSGVTPAEPMLGSKESPLRTQRRYSSSIEISDGELYNDEIVAQDYYPNASVGYSRVISKHYSTNSGESNWNQPMDLDHRVEDGIFVNEFYTAKDFPVVVKQELQEKTPTRSIKKLAVSLPFSNTRTHHVLGTSQSITIETNDMHGKSKSQSVYTSIDNFTGDLSGVNPHKETKYIYSTDATNPKKLNDKFNAAEDISSSLSQVSMGRDVDIAIEASQNYTINKRKEKQFNGIIIESLPFLIPVEIPYKSEHKENVQTISTVKHIAQQGIVEEVESFDNGMHSSMKNLVFNKKYRSGVVNRNR